MEEAVVGVLAQRTEGVAAARTQAHGGVGLQHHGRATGPAGTVHDVGHQVQGVLKQQAIVARKLVLPDQQLHLLETHSV